MIADRELLAFVSDLTSTVAAMVNNLDAPDHVKECQLHLAHRAAQAGEEITIDGVPVDAQPFEITILREQSEGES